MRGICDGCDAVVADSVLNARLGTTGGGFRDFGLCPKCIEIFREIDPRTWPRRISQGLGR